MRQYGGPEQLEFREYPDPSSPGAEEILVKVSACGVCGHDLLARRGALCTPLPVVLGHEISGVVSAVGGAIVDFAIGDRVALVQRVPCGQCAVCTAGAENLCRVGPGFYGEDQPGGYAEYVLSSPRNTVKLPADVSLEAGAILSCAIGTGWHALRRAHVTPDDLVVVTGAGGGVGVHVLQLCRYLGAEVLAVTNAPSKRTRLLELGADHVVSLGPGEASIREQVRAQTGGRMADVVIEVAGPPTFAQSVRALGARGRLAMVGNVEPRDVVMNPGLVILKELSVFGSAHGTKRDLEEVVRLVTGGHVSPVIAERFPLTEAARAHEVRATGGPVGRRVLIPGPVSS